MTGFNIRRQPGSTESDPAQISRRVRASFPYPRFFDHQEQAWQAALSGRDCLVVAGTGGGKSLCYGAFALARPGLVVVVCPLIALMRDQVNYFTGHGISCETIHSHQDNHEKSKIWQRVEAGAVRLLFVSPERLSLPSFRLRLARLRIALIAIDEAHVALSWGRRFRPDYGRLANFLQDFADVPRMALTATLAEDELAELNERLGLREAEIIRGDLGRPNLQTSMYKATSEAWAREQLAASVGSQSGIIYCPTKRRARALADVFRAKGLSFELYHGGLSARERLRTEAFFRRRHGCIIATNAFGLGINKPDVRYVHHYGMPGSETAYLQEIGRAGRDGKPAQCHLYYTPKDFYLQTYLIEQALPDPAMIRRAFLKLHREGPRFGTYEVFRDLLRKDWDDQKARPLLDVLIFGGFLKGFAGMTDETYLAKEGEFNINEFAGQVDAIRECKLKALRQFWQKVTARLV